MSSEARCSALKTGLPNRSRYRRPVSAPRRSATVGWIIYDLANTIFALGVASLYFPEWITQQGLPDSYLAVTTALGGVVVVMAAPWIGARSDHTGRRVPALAVTTVVAVAATSLLTRGPIWLTFAFFGLAVVALNIGSVVYDALLPTVSTPETRGRVSGTGVGVGYLGSFVGLGIGIVTFDVLGWDHAATFTTLALAFAVFSIPTFLFVRDKPHEPSGARPPGIAAIVPAVVRSWQKARAFPDVVRFLIGRFFYTDAINTLIGGFLVIFAIEELGLDREGSELLIGLAIVGAMIGGLGGGRLVERSGARRTLRVVLVAWVVTILGAVTLALTDTPELIAPLGILGGLALGATWASDRVLMMRVSPPEYLGEFYGLYATVGRFATILGPLVWALIVDVLDLGRSAAMVVLAVFVATGWWILRGVQEPLPGNQPDDSPHRPVDSSP